MADITMCNNNNCKIRHACYRAMAKQSDYQSWAEFGKYDGDCEDFVEYVPAAEYADHIAD